MKERSKGFTLVELSIVLIIIGLLFTVVLKGAELINAAKVRSAYKMSQEIFAAFYLYYDKFVKFPGDDNTVSQRWTGAQNGNNNGLIDGGFVYNCAGAEVAGLESCNAWSHLRWANLIIGEAGNTINPQHPYGGAISVAYANVNGVSANWIAFQNVPRDAAYSIDKKYDDGIYNKGSIQASSDFIAAGPPVDLYFRL
jgi:prepilin-type N-terminal cleavage/methylation domain-containing protein